ncbi:Uncharacterised protein [Shigella flexneri]|nr:Uncharacterised protein [Shigella flexneri]
MIGHQFRVHLCQPGFILGDVVYFHHRPGGKAGFGITFVPVAAIATMLGAKVPRYQVGDKAHILRTHAVARLDLPGEDRADILFGDIRIEMRHRKRLLPGIPRPGLIAGEPASGHRRRDGVIIHRTAR